MKLCNKKSSFSTICSADRFNWWNMKSFVHALLHTCTIFLESRLKNLTYKCNSIKVSTTISINKISKHVVHFYCFRGVGYPALSPSATCQQPLDVSNDFTFKVIDGILSGNTHTIHKNKITPSDSYYLSLVWMYLDTKICLDTSILETRNMGRREWHFIKASNSNRRLLNGLNIFLLFIQILVRFLSSSLSIWEGMK
jgi:hypothetical protein